MNFIDTHAHLSYEQEKRFPDLDQVLAKAEEAGVEKIVCVSTNLADSQKSLGLAAKNNLVLAAVGIHPQQTDPQTKLRPEEQLEELEKLAVRAVAIGECGLDPSPVAPGERQRPEEEQWLLFDGQIELAKKYNKPLLIHSRRAFAETVARLEKFSPPPRGVFHCYSAGKKGLAKVEELGYFIGFDGNLTYDTGLQEVAKIVPLERIVLETDTPFLAPIPLKGQRNEPANLVLVAKMLAKIKNVPEEKIAGQTTKNAKKILSLK